MTSGVYTIANTTNGKVYIGSAVDLDVRKRRHITALRKGNHHSTKLQRAWSKYGESAFKFSTLLVCDPTQLIMYEQLALDGYHAVDRGYNVLRIAGSSAGYKHTEETKRKLSEMFMGHQRGVGIPCSEGKKLKIGEANKGRVRTKETLLKLSIARKGRTPSLGMVHTEEAKRRMSEKRKGKKRSAEAIAKTVAGLLGRKHTPEAIEKMRIAVRNRIRRPLTEETKIRMKENRQQRKESISIPTTKE